MLVTLRFNAVEDVIPIEPVKFRIWVSLEESRQSVFDPARFALFLTGSNRAGISGSEFPVYVLSTRTDCLVH